MPVFLPLENRPCLVVACAAAPWGATLSKVRALARAGARVTLACDAGPARVREAQDAGASDVVPLDEAGAHIPRQGLAILNSPDQDRVARLGGAIRSQGSWVNVVDQPNASDFIFGALVDRSPVLVAITTGGQAPAAARALRQRLEGLLPGNLGEAVAWSAPVRSALQAAGMDSATRARVWSAFWEHVFSLETSVPLSREGATDPAAFAETWATPPEARLLVLDAPEAPDLLTLRDVRQLSAARTVLADARCLADFRFLFRREARLRTPSAPGYPELREALDDGGLSVWLCRGGERPPADLLEDVRRRGLRVDTPTR
nr:bifunctional precorrin-2 dehydrogenase/sirohydrochlorin ferrochelatase [Phaeovibrio sulfidiphilus]